MRSIGPLTCTRSLSAGSRMRSTLVSQWDSHGRRFTNSFDWERTGPIQGRCRRTRHSTGSAIGSTPAWHWFLTQKRLGRYFTNSSPPRRGRCGTLLMTLISQRSQSPAAPHSFLLIQTSRFSLTMGCAGSISGRRDQLAHVSIRPRPGLREARKDQLKSQI